MKWNYVVWPGWVALFLILELSGLWGWTPWTTLSEFSWHLEDEHWVIHALFFGFLLGLAMHIVFKGEMWKTQLAGLVFAFLVHFVNSRWP